MKVAVSACRAAALRCRHLDEIAQHIVVAHPQAFHAGRLAIAGLQLGDDAACIAGKGALCVEFLVITARDEPAIARLQRQFPAERRVQPFSQRTGNGATDVDMAGQVCAAGTISQRVARGQRGLQP